MTAETLWWRVQYAGTLGNMFELAREQVREAAARGMPATDINAWFADIARWELEGDKQAAEDAIWNLDGWSLTGAPRPGSAQARPADAFDSAMQGYKDLGQEGADAAASALNNLLKAGAKTVWDQPVLRTVVVVAGVLGVLGVVTWALTLRKAVS